MKNYTLLFLFIFYQASSQSNLNLVFNLPDQVTTTISKLLIETDTIVTIGSVTDSPGKFGIQFSKYDSLGNLIFYQTHYPGDNEIYTLGRFTGFIQLVQGAYLTTTSVGAGNKIAIIKLAHNGEMLWNKEIDYPDLQVIYCDGLVEIADGYLIAGWQQDLNYQTQAFICKLNRDGEILWKKEYGSSNDDFAFTIKKRNDNSYFIGGEEAKHQSGVSAPGHWERSWFFEIDSVGNKLWEYKTTAAEFVVGKNFELVGDTALVFAASRMPHYISPWLTELVLRKININTNTSIWQKAQTGADMTYTVGYSDLAVSPTGGGYDIVGTYQHYPNGFVQGGFSAHTSPEGDLLWMRQDTGWMDPNLNVDENYLNCLGHLSSGSIIAGGDVLKSQPVWHNEAWLLKISPKGCISVDDCAPVVSATSGPSASKTFSSWALYPNPTSGRAMLLPDQQAVGRQGRLVAFDLSGLQVFDLRFPFQTNEPVPVDFGPLSRGIYHYQVWLDNHEVGGGKVLITH